MSSQLAQRELLHVNDIESSRSRIELNDPQVVLFQQKREDSQHEALNSREGSPQIFLMQDSGQQQGEGATDRAIRGASPLKIQKVSSENFNEINKSKMNLSSKNKVFINEHSQQIIQELQVKGKYKPIHERLSEIKAHGETVRKQIAAKNPPKQEDCTFYPLIDHNSQRIMQQINFNKINNNHQSSSYQQQESQEQSVQESENKNNQKWNRFLEGKQIWNDKKLLNIHQKQNEKALVQKQIHTFKPVINQSSMILYTDRDSQERGINAINQTASKTNKNVVERLYLKYEDKKSRDKKRIEDSMSTFTPKINSYSEKLFFKMCNGESIPLEERITNRSYSKLIAKRSLSQQQQNNITASSQSPSKNSFFLNAKKSERELEEQEEIEKEEVRKIERQKINETTFNLKGNFSIVDRIPLSQFEMRDPNSTLSIYKLQNKLDISRTQKSDRKSNNALSKSPLNYSMTVPFDGENIANGMHSYNKNNNEGNEHSHYLHHLNQSSNQNSKRGQNEKKNLNLILSLLQKQ